MRRTASVEVTSERELQADLELAHRDARAVDRPVERARQRHLRVAPHRVVEQVERLEAELQRLRAPEEEVADEGGVGGENARADDDVASGVPVGERRLAGERRGVEPLLRRLGSS